MMTKTTFGCGLGVLMGVLMCAGCADTPVNESTETVHEHAPAPTSEPAPAPVQALAEVRETLECPSLDFHKFIDAFAESAEVQRAFTIVPIKFRRNSSAALEEYKGELQFPLFPSREKRVVWKMDYDVVELSAVHAKISLHLTANTASESLYAYYFRKDACWQLEFYEQPMQRPAP
jgi:hypothetical protein